MSDQNWKYKTLDGMVAIVTGANTGIGKATACDLAIKGARVILACRNLEKAKAAVDDIVRSGSVNPQNLVVMKLDLVDFQSVRDFAEEFSNNESRLDLLINNAGIIEKKRTITKEGNELTFQVNHLGPFLLTNLLLDKLKYSAPSRVVNLSSGVYRMVRINLNNLNFERGWSTIKSYSASKLANIYFTTELAKRLEGTGVATYAVHPGAVKTEIARDYTDNCFFKCLACMFKRCILTPEKGASTTIYCSTADGITNGAYFEKCKEASLKRHARDEETAAKLWRISEELVGLTETKHSANDGKIGYGTIATA